jgi:hypothetical protein
MIRITNFENHQHADVDPDKLAGVLTAATNDGSADTDTIAAIQSVLTPHDGLQPQPGKGLVG